MSENDQVQQVPLAASLTETPRQGGVSLGVVCLMANEAATASVFVTQVLENCRGMEKVNFYAVLDNACHDATLETLRRLSFDEPRLRVIWAPENRSIVDAYVRGYREALLGGCDYVLEIDTGFSHLPIDIPKFLDALDEGYDCVFGSRFMPGGITRETPLFRRLISQGGSLITNALVGTRLQDMTSGFELFSRKSLEMVLARGIHSRAHFFQTEIKYYCRDLRIKEVPITYKTDAAGVGRRALLDAFKNLGRLIWLRWLGTRR